MKLLQQFRIITMMLLLSSLTHASIPNHDNPNTFLGPYAGARYTNFLNNYVAYSFAGEAGIKNYRVSGTAAFYQEGWDRFKVTGEYLRQKITYPFFTGNTDEWVSQGALGANYQYIFDDEQFQTMLDMGAYVSHAPSKTLSTVTASYLQDGATNTVIESRRIAGSTGFGVAPGITMAPWQGGSLSAYVNYDSVTYDTVYVTNKDAKGLGGTLGMTQTLSENINIGGSAAFRQPFNNYHASINFIESPYYGNWTVGIEGDYTVGKNSLPSTYNVGLQVAYSTEKTQHYKSSLEDEKSFLAWTSKPAIYMPEVLAVPDGSICTPPSFTGTISTIDTNSTTSVNVSGNFSGSNLSYSETHTINGGNISISSSGILTLGLSADFGFVTITATNSCGSATSNSFAAGAGS